MKLIETLYLGCDSSEGIAEPHNSYTIRFCMSTVFAHGTLAAQLCPAFVKAQLLYEEGVVSKPFHVSVIFPFDMNHIRKPTDVETAYERIVWYLKNLKVPGCGMVVSLYQNLNGRPWITDSWKLDSLWPFRKQWNPNGTYITIQKIEPLVGGVAKRNLKADIEFYPSFENKAKSLAEQYGFDVRYVDYLTPYQELYELMLGSSYHFSYPGATYFFAGLCGTPTIGWGERPDYSSISYYEPFSDNRIFETIQVSRWGRLGTNPGRIQQFNHDVNVVMNMPAKYASHIEEPDELDNIFQTRVLSI